MSDRLHSEFEIVDDADDDGLFPYDWQDDLRGEKMDRISASVAEMFLALVAWISVVACALFAVYEIGRVIVNGQ